MTVAKRSISNIRRNKYSQIEALQIDGSIIPGNSGGPIVDAKGRLVGVSVAAVREPKSVLYPCGFSSSRYGGRVDTVSLTNHLLGGGTFSVDARITVIDPLGALTPCISTIGFARSTQNGLWTRKESSRRMGQR